MIASLHYHTRTNPGLAHTTHAQQPLQTVDLENRRRRRHHVVHGRRTISLLQGLEKANLLNGHAVPCPQYEVVFFPLLQKRGTLFIGT